MTEEEAIQQLARLIHQPTLARLIGDMVYNAEIRIIDPVTGNTVSGQVIGTNLNVLDLFGTPMKIEIRYS